MFSKSAIQILFTHHKTCYYLQICEKEQNQQFIALLAVILVEFFVSI